MVADNSARMRLIAAGMLLLTGALAQTGAAVMSQMHGMWIAWFGLFGYLYSLVLCVCLLLPNYTKALVTIVSLRYFVTSITIVFRVVYLVTAAVMGMSARFTESSEAMKTYFSMKRGGYQEQGYEILNQAHQHGHFVGSMMLANATYDYRDHLGVTASRSIKILEECLTRCNTVDERSLAASALSSIYESGHFDVKPDADKASMYRRTAMAANDFSRAADESWEIFLAGSKRLFKQMPTILLPGYPLWVIGWSDKTP